MHAILLDALYTILILSLIPMLAISFGAGAVTLLQAVTQVQEQSIVHLVRLAIITAVIIWGGGRALSRIEMIFLKVISFAAIPEAG